jgi:hypothetical protein
MTMLSHTIADGRRPGFDTRAHLRKAEEQARQRRYDRFTIVDVDAHHYESQSWPAIFKYIEDPVTRHLAESTPGGRGARCCTPRRRTSTTPGASCTTAGRPTRSPSRACPST